MVSFPKYDSYKSSGVEWLGDIPKGWELTSGRTCFIKQEIKNKGNIEKTVLSLSYGKIVIKPPEKLYGLVPESFETYQIVNKGNIIVRSTDLQNDKVSLRIGLVKNKGIITSAYLCLRTTEKITYEFAYYLLHAYDLLKVYYGMGSGLRQNLSFTDFKYLKLPVPPLPEQIKIAEFLDEKTTQIDNIISKKQRLIELLEEQKTIIINQAVTKGLNPNAPMKNSGIEWLGDIPESWEVCKLKFIKSKKKNAFVDGPFGSNLKSEHFIENGDVYVIESGHITSGIFRKKETFKTISLNHFQTISRSECQEGDIIIAKIGANYGMNAILPKLDKLSVVSGNSLKLSIDNNIALTKFIHYSLLDAKINNVFLDIVNTSAQPALSLGLLNNIKMPLPPIEEQAKIVNFIEQKTAEIDNLKEKTQQQIDKLKEYKQILIANAVTGKIAIS